MHFKIPEQSSMQNWVSEAKIWSGSEHSGKTNIAALATYGVTEVCIYSKLQLIRVV